MENPPQINRNAIVKNAEFESELSDLKQHADKMIRGFENFNDFSSNRAIWELIQNACDLTTNCEVIIDYSKPNFSFSHNGKPFSTRALISLIKQVSGKYGEETDVPEVGKYGTGFLTTHTFGRKFLINSILAADNAFFKIDDFLIDRSPKEWIELSKNIKEQKDNVYKLIREGAVLEQPYFSTTFTFIPQTQQEKDYIEKSKLDLNDYIPIVLTINDRLKKVKIIDFDKNEKVYVRKEKKPFPNDSKINLFITTISINNEDGIICSLIDEEDEIEVILPIDKNLDLIQFPERVARLFLYYPLIGSEHFGLNFIINCNKFLPTEPRDGIHLKSNKDQVKEQEEENRRIIKKASELIFSFLKSNILKISNPLLYAKINFKRDSDNHSLNEYFKELQLLWTNEFKQLNLVETSNGQKSVKDVYFFAKELLENNSVFDEIYQLAATFFQNIPTKSSITSWSNFVDEWKDEELKFITHHDLVTVISKESLEKFNKSDLLKYYDRLIAQGQTNLFSEFELLPNIYGKFCLQTHLLTPHNLTDELIEIGRVLIPDSINRLIHQDFIFKFNFDEFTRRDFSNAVKTNLDENEVSKQICKPKNYSIELFNEIENSQIKSLDFTYFANLINYCKQNTNLYSQSKPSQLVKIICKYYSLDDNLIHLPNLENSEENIDIRSSRKILVQVFFNLIELHNTSWVKDNIFLLLEIANCFEDSLKEVFLNSKIYPNQLYQLKTINELKRDIDLIPDIIDLYDKVTSNQVKSKLIYNGFNEFVKEEDKIINHDLTSQIEIELFNDGIHNISEHPFKKEILEILEIMKHTGTKRAEEYTKLFPLISSKKSSILVELADGDDSFSILSLEASKIKKLAELGNNPNFEEIVKLGQEALLKQQQEHANFQHKYTIGTHIESILRRSLAGIISENMRAEIENVQDGQDIIISINDKAVYYIEVKSRWDINSPIRMSKNQTLRANEQKDNYALCSVDMTKYTGENKFSVENIDEIKHCIKFNNDIGNEVVHLIDILNQTNEPDIIHLEGDYRTLIPMRIIDRGASLNEFEQYLIEFLKTSYAN